MADPEETDDLPVLDPEQFTSEPVVGDADPQGFVSNDLSGNPEGEIPESTSEDEQ